MLWLFVIALAYGVAWMSDAALGDPCLLAGDETDRVDYVQRWLPAAHGLPGHERRRRDAAREGLGGGLGDDVRCSPLLLAAALLSRAGLALRAAAALTACVAAFVVIFVW